MTRPIALALCLAAIAGGAFAAETSVSRPPSNVDFAGFASLTRTVAEYRRDRLVGLEDFQAMGTKRGTLILDARSADAYARGHIAGAVNLPFTDFTAESLARVIGDPNRRILIYCNNNFANDVEPVRMKASVVALNIQTFVNLYGYGYRNVYELADKVDLTDPVVAWVSQANPTKSMAFIPQP